MFFMERVLFVGAVVGNGMVVPLEERFKALEHWPVPRDQTELRSFMGFIQFMSPHIPNLANLLAPLSRLRAKDYNTRAKFIEGWDLTCTKAFVDVKAAAMLAVAGNVFDSRQTLIIATDTSPLDIGVVAAHPVDPAEGDNPTATTQYRPNAFYSRLLRPPEANKPQAVREFIGCGYGVKATKSYRGLKWAVAMDTDYWIKLLNRSDMKPSVNTLCTKILMYILNEPAAPGWPKFIFRPGRKHADADGLSRRLPTAEELGEQVYGNSPLPLVRDEISDEITPERYAVEAYMLDGSVANYSEFVYLGAIRLG